MHKSKGNAIWFDEAVEKMGADIMRWLYTAQNPHFPLPFGYTPAKEAARHVSVIWNLGNYVQQYCTKKKGKGLPRGIHHQWMLSRRESVKAKVTQHLERLEPHLALQELKTFLLDDLSRTYGQLICEELDHAGVQSLLAQTFLDGLKILGPFLPFNSEKVYRELYAQKLTLFLEDWPAADKKRIKPDVE